MVDENSGGLTPKEKEAFSKLPNQKIPPEDLREKTLVALRSAGLLKSNGSGLGSKLFRFGLTAFVAVLLFTFGVYVGQTRPIEEQPLSSLYALLIYDTPEFFGEGPGKAEVYANWIHEVNKQGHFAVGSKLVDSGQVLKISDDGYNVINLPHDKRYKSLKGYVLLEAESMADAIRIASTSPHLKFKGIFDVRKVHFVVQNNKGGIL